jgi:hypothetical protein
MASIPGTLFSTPAVVSTAAPATPTPAFVFQTVGEMYTCGSTTVRWGYTGPSALLSLNISNINVNQQPPLPVSSAAAASASSTAPIIDIREAHHAKRQNSGYGGSYLPPVDVVVASGLDPSSATWTWSAVNVPQGWYEILANVQGVIQSTSGSFFVQNGTNINCVPQYAVISSPSTNVPLSPSASPSANPVRSGGSHTGAIAGGIIGGIACLAAALSVLLFCFFRRRQRSRHNQNDEISNDNRWSVLGIGKSRHTSYARSSLQKAHADLPTLVADQAVKASDEELSTFGHEKAVAADYPMPPHYEPHSLSNRASAQTTGSNGRVFNPEPLARRGSYTAAGTVEVIPLERAHTIGGGTRRKPVPRYEDADEMGRKGNGDGTSSSRTTLESIHANPDGYDSTGGTHVLQHQSSFGAMRPMHVMIPDPPPPTHH